MIILIMSRLDLVPCTRINLIKAYQSSCDIIEGTSYCLHEYALSAAPAILLVACVSQVTQISCLVCGVSVDIAQGTI